MKYRVVLPIRVVDHHGMHGRDTTIEVPIEAPSDEAAVQVVALALRRLVSPDSVAYGGAAPPA
jgi:hypothetical protein